MPNVQINGHCALANAQLVYGHGCVVNQLHPPNHATGSTLKPANTSACGPHFAKIKTHATAKLAHLSKVVDAAVDAFKTVGNGVDEATRQLMERLACIG